MDKAHTLAHMEGQQLWTDLSKANEEIERLTAEVSNLKFENEVMLETLHEEGVTIDFASIKESDKDQLEVTDNAREHNVNILGFPFRVIAGAPDDCIIFVYDGRFVGRIAFNLTAPSASQVEALDEDSQK